MECLNCKAQLSEGNKFCTECGAPVSTACPSCGLGNPPQAKFCANCGTKLAGVSPAPAVGSPPPARVSAESSAERRQLTVMFCDLVGSTELSTSLDPEDLRKLLSAYHACVVETVRPFAGFVAKYMGDGVLIYFGYPVAHEDEASRAVRAGLSLIEVIPQIASKVGVAPLQVRIGVATGLVVVGDLIGEGSAQESAIVGATPNLAARLQSLAAPGQLLVAPSTRELVRGEFDFEALQPQSLKGFTKPLVVSRVIASRILESRFEARTVKLTPLVGRDEEIELLLRRWEYARDGDGQLVLLSGEPGVGKSRISRAFLQRIENNRGADFLRLRYQCSPHYVNTSFRPFIEQIERAAGLQNTDDLSAKLDRLEALLARGTRYLTEIMPLFVALLSLPVGPRYPALTLTAEKQKEKTVEALIEQLTELALKRPVVMLFEDAHWIDPSSLEVLNAIVDAIAGRRILAIVTFRPDFSALWSGRPNVTSLALSRLARRQSLAMVERVAGGKALPPEILDQIVAKTDGIPLFVEELTKTVLESGLLLEGEEDYRLAGPMVPLAIPSTLQDSLMSRLDRLATVKDVAQIGAAIGREFSFQLLALVSQAPESQLREAIDQLVASELIFIRRGHPDAVYTFKHALVQDAAYESLLKSRRQQLHQLIARSLEERWPETKENRPELLAHHFERAGVIGEAVAYGLRAGQNAARRSAFSEAIAHLRQALQLVSTLPAAQYRQRQDFEIRAELADVLMATKGYAAPDVGAAFQNAYAICDPVASAGERLAVLWGLFAYHLVRAEYHLCLSVGRRALRFGMRTSEAEPYVMAHTMLGQALVQYGKLHSARRHFDLALSRSVPQTTHSGPASALPDPHVILLAYSALNQALMGDPRRAQATMGDALAQAAASTRPHQIVLVLGYSLRLHYCLRNESEIESLASMLARLASEHGFAQYKAAAATWNAWLEARHGTPSRAVAMLEKGISAYEATGAVWTVPFMLLQLADVYRHAGENAKVEQTLDQAMEWIERTQWRWLLAEVHRLKGQALLDLGDTERAIVRFQRSLEEAQRQGARLWEFRARTNFARLLLNQGNKQAASDLLLPVRNWFDQFGTADVVDAESLLDRIGSATHS